MLPGPRSARTRSLGLTIYNGGTLHIDDGKPTPAGMAEALSNLREIAPTVCFDVPTGFEAIADAMKADAELRILATSGARRSAYLPEVPAFPESGFPDLTIEECFGFLAPAKTPANVLAAANAAVNAALKDQGILDSLAATGLLPHASTPQETAAPLQTEYERWGPLHWSRRGLHAGILSKPHASA